MNRARILLVSFACLLGACGADDEPSTPDTTQSDIKGAVAAPAAEGDGSETTTATTGSAAAATTTEQSVCASCGPLPDPWVHGPLPDPWRPAATSTGSPTDTGSTHK